MKDSLTFFIILNQNRFNDFITLVSQYVSMQAYHSKIKKYRHEKVNNHYCSTGHIYFRFCIRFYGRQRNQGSKRSFEKKFNGARGVSWKESNDLFFASFELNQRKLTAAYNADGELLGLSRNISISEVPLTVSESLKRNFGDYQILESVTEVLYDGQTSYYINAENATRSLQLKCYADGEIAITKRVKK